MAQVLLRMQPKSYTTSCSATTKTAIASSVVPPGVTMPANADLPPLVMSLALPLTLMH